MKMRLMTILLLGTLSCSSYGSERSPNVIHVTRNKSNGRVDAIEKKLSAADLVPGAPLTGEVKNHVKMLSAPHDVIGVILDEKLGGPGNETFNAIPMNPSAQETWKTKVVDQTYNYLMANKSQEVMFVVMPFYENVNLTRPYGFGVFVNEVSNSNAHIVKGYIPNPPKRISETVAPYIYSTGRLWVVERKNESFDIVGVRGDQSPSERVEMATKFVRLSDLTTGTEMNEVTRNHTRALAGNEPYVPGLLLSQKLGGKGDDPYNVVPMDPKALEELKTRVEVPTLAFFSDPSNKDKTMVIAVIVLYADHTSTRPVGFIVLSRQSPSYTMYIPNQ